MPARTDNTTQPLVQWIATANPRHSPSVHYTRAARVHEPLRSPASSISRATWDSGLQ